MGDPAPRTVGAALAPLNALRNRIRLASWFAAVGEELTTAERWDTRAYLAGLGFADTGVAAVPDWKQAAAVAKSPDWSRDWWDREESERTALLARAGTLMPEHELMAALSWVMELSASITHGAAAIAASRSGVADQALSRVAAGAAAQSAYQAALAAIGHDGESEHPFSIKFRLFEAGRWPLGITGGSFHLF
ncbi:MAG: hypothetical protein K0S54_2671 [Alphaproteobacteria bacterium]|nr:hypothetical protein [Alphaproteobacteria bacterium]